MKEARKAYEAASQLDPAERDRILLEQLAQVRYIARRIHDRLPQHVDLEDMVHAGVLGLIDALHKYDPTKNVQLKSYAKFRIRGAILDSLRGMDWGSRDLRMKARRIEKACSDIEARFGRAASETEIAAEMGMDLKELQRILGDLRGLDLGSLETFTSEEGGLPWVYHYAPSSPDDDPFFLCLGSEMKSLLAQAIGELPPRDRQVLALYYYKELSMKEVGMVLGVNESRISQIHSTAIVRMRARLQQLLAARPIV